MRRGLLDVNVLIALMDPMHTQHRHARAWFESDMAQGWASCPLTENGFVRVMSQPAYPRPLAVGTAIRVLRRARATSLHEFWPCDGTITDPEFLDEAHILGPKVITDAYLVGLAATHGGRFVTFDRRVASAVAPGADPDSILIL